MNRRAKFDAASFILGGEICNRTKKSKKHTNSKRYIHTLPICVDNNVQSAREFGVFSVSLVHVIQDYVSGWDHRGQ